MIENCIQFPLKYSVGDHWAVEKVCKILLSAFIYFFNLAGEAVFYLLFPPVGWWWNVPSHVFWRGWGGGGLRKINFGQNWILNGREKNSNKNLIARSQGGSYDTHWARDTGTLSLVISKLVYNSVMNLLILYRKILCSLFLATTWQEKLPEEFTEESSRSQSKSTKSNRNHHCQQQLWFIWLASSLPHNAPCCCDQDLIPFIKFWSIPHLSSL